ncbi:hypothetical protein PPSIR1_22219 [Plesiocystis pacifica SIR-1]|uniref:Uncharacterized protein n=1 Tax=Plesiocystis pacifica SIR-1 TaxID=391625 RepID=A6FXU1_9BACT|nr:hypothetical protein [Plesiocystis pacifica]EDM81679.1 hypothetical protein PPSIR1_22219 [Plesiocystis pacifica SIR-1]
MKQSREQRFYPWAYEDHGLRLRVLGASLDDRPVELVEPHANSVELGTNWAHATLELELRAPGRLVRRLVAKHERDSPPVAVLITLRCPRTHLRRRVALQAWPSTEGERFGIPLALVRDELAGLVELDAHLIRTAPAADPSAGARVASLAGTRLAGSRTLTLLLDQPEVRAGNYLDVHYRRFSDDPGAPNASALYRLELEGETPILYLNADHESLRPTLDSKGTRGPRARVRDLVFERIASSVWTQLVLRVSARLVDDGEPAYDWERAVLDQWLPRLYPERRAEERQSCLERDFQDLPMLLARLDAILQVEGKLAALAAKLTGEFS